MQVEELDRQKSELSGAPVLSSSAGQGTEGKERLLSFFREVEKAANGNDELATMLKKYDGLARDFGFENVAPSDTAAETPRAQAGPWDKNQADIARDAVSG